MGAAVRGPPMAMPRRHGDPRPALGADDDDEILPVHGLIKLIFL